MTNFRPQYVNAHINLKQIGKWHYVKILPLIKEMMDLSNAEPLLVRYDDKTKTILIHKEKGVAGSS